MGMKPNVPNDGAIQQQIGSAYDVVKSVADNLPAIIAVTEAVEEAQVVITQITEQVELATEAANNATAVVGEIESLKDQAESARDLTEGYKNSAETATKLAATVNINGIPFDGSQPITIPAPGSVATAGALTTARAITITGDADWTVNFKGDAAVTAALTLKNVSAGGTGTKITFNTKGLVTGSSSLIESDIPNLSWSKITSGVPSFALTSDSRFTDAREWTAATVTQTDAEAGTNTTRVAWTAQRVAQAIAAQAAPKTSTESRLSALESAPDAEATARKALALAIMGL